MKLVALLKEKRQQIQKGNGELIKRFEPQMREFREFRESINQSVYNSLANNVWLSKFVTVANEEEPAVALNPLIIELHHGLSTKIGSELHLSDWHQVTQQQIDQFALVTGDSQWIHTDADRARAQSPFKSTVAHGFLLLSLLPKLRGLEEYAAQNYPGARMVINSGLNDVRFIAPVKPGQAVRSRTTLKSVALHKRGVDIVEDVVLELQKSERRICTASLAIKAFV